jgi:hypothetical protein
MIGLTLRQRVRVYAKAATGTSPEAWTVQSSWKRANIAQSSTADVLDALAAYNFQPTHTVKVEYDAAFAMGRLLVDDNGNNYIIHRVTSLGRQGGGGRTLYQRLLVAQKEPAEV